MGATVFPAICLGLDMIMNKVYIRFFQIKFTIIINALYFLVSFVLQAEMRSPMYIDNLNFFCDKNQAFLYSAESSIKGNAQEIIHKNLIYETCETWEKKFKQPAKGPHVYCEPLTKTYYCNSKTDDLTGLKHLGAVPYSPWKNCWLLITVVMIVSTLSFCLSYGMHLAKLCGVKGYNGHR